MSEFVEEKLEQLLPVYELLHTVQLLTTKEVNEFIRRCRSYEYRLQKSVKDANDFALYADYLKDVLELIRIRRRRLKYFFKHNEIDGTIKAKIADVYRRCTERFKGCVEVWRKRLDFLKKENMLVRCSRAFFRAVQVLGRDVNLRVEAALWEFKKNKSVDNARLHLQLGLRLFPESHLLWITLFRIEILNVKRLLKRRDVLAGKYSKRRGEALESEEIGEGAAEEQGIISDAVLNLKLAEIVAEQALNSPEVTEKNVLLYRLWQTANEYGVVAKRLEDILYEKLWSEGNICEESFIAKHERQKDETDVYGIYDEAIARFPTSRMFRYYIEICEERIVADDVFAGAKLRDIYKLMEEKGLAGMEDYKKLLELEGDNSEKERIVERALQRFHSSSFLWSRLLRLKMSDGKTSKRDIQKLFNDAERALKSEDMLEIYELAIDWAIQNAPSTVDAIFQRAVMLTPCDVSSEIKCIRLRYLKAAYPSDPSVYRNEYSKICAAPPNAMVVHKAFIKLERELKEPDDKLIVRAMENCVADFGYEDYKCWIEYAKYLFNHDPPALASLYQRAIVCVPKEQSDAFVTEWTRLLQHTSKQPHQKRPIKNRKIKKGISNKAEKRPKLSS